jgi:glutamate-1-semialdehyde 2,1-aminomutase
MPNGVKTNSDYPVIEKSLALLERAKKRIPCMTQTLAKGAGQFVRGVAPVFADRAKGSHIWDVDGNEYLDFNSAIGPISLGYGYERVDNAIKEQLAKGITFSLPHPLEVEVAELISEMVPNAESVRFSKTGADMASAAVRLSRAFTGKKKVVCCGYHGWHDWYIGLTDRNKGIPEEIKALSTTCTYNNIESVEAAIDDDTACVILEPLLFEEPKDNFLFKLKELCKKKGALLIFDEMWTGFRVAPGGAQELYDVKADLSTYSKAIANGMPISVLAGRADVMKLLEKDVFFFTTFGGEALSLAATKATMLEIREKNVPKYLNDLGDKLKAGLNELATKLEMPYVKCIGLGCRTLLMISPDAGNQLETKSLVQQELIKRGIIWTGQHALNFSHTQADIDYALQAYGEVLPILKKAVDEKNVKSLIRGEMIEPLFRTLTGTIPQKAKN